MSTTNKTHQRLHQNGADEHQSTSPPQGSAENESGDPGAIHSAMPIIDEAEISARIEDLEIAEDNGNLTHVQRHELKELRRLVEQLMELNSDEYFVPNLYREGVQPLPGACVDYRWVVFDGVSYLAISTAED